MKQPKLYIIRGIPGSGKTTFSNTLLRGIRASGQFAGLCEADMYFIDKEGVYRFDREKLGAAHEFCRWLAEELLVNGDTAVVANTFTTKKEIRPYIELAKKYDADVTVITMNGNFENVHGVPPEHVKRMRERFEHDVSDLL